MKRRAKYIHLNFTVPLTFPVYKRADHHNNPGNPNSHLCLEDVKVVSGFVDPGVSLFQAVF